MSKAKIVIGLQFGDEGKGITTDYLCSKNDDSKIVVRFSGGQQAGHNVVIGDVSHVHSNFGSGTLRGVPSYFSEHCTIYPLTMFRERQVLAEKSVIPNLAIHPKTMITTPADVAFNRVTERVNGHGSCGLGVGATMNRNLKTGYKLYAIDLTNPDILREKIENVRRYYWEPLKGTGLLSKYNEEEKKESDLFFDALDAMRYSFNIQPYSYLHRFREIIFEGSQGVLLDMDHGIFPKVTYANTTTKNALEICDQLRIKREAEIYYVTRCYQTRHGAGWMSDESNILLVNNQEEINTYNEWQEDFRIGELDYNLLNYSLRIDDIYSEGITKNLVVTCLDQRPDFKFDHTKLNVKFKKIFHSKSPESEQIKWINK